MSQRARSASVMAIVWLVACGGSTSSIPTDPLTEVHSRSAAAVDDAVDVATEVADELEEVTFEVRFNPAACQCPVWEMRFRGAWTRTYVDATAEFQPLLAALLARAQTDRDDGTLATYRATGRLSDDLIEASTGMRYRTLWLHRTD